MKTKCPTCQDEFEVQLSAVVPEGQIMHMKLVSETELFDAETIGKTLINFAKLQKEFGKSVGIKVETFLKSLDLSPKEITIGFYMVQQKDQT